METKDILSKISEEQNSFCIAYINGEKQPGNLFATIINKDVIPIFYQILEAQGHSKKISLIIRSNGGNLDTPWPLISLLREYCDELEILIPENAHSAATLISLAGDEIIMTPISSLSPIDPQVFLEKEKEKETLEKFSVEDISEYYALLDKSKNGKIKAIELISESINPTILGKIERIRKLIDTYTRNILSSRNTKEKKIKSIVEKLVKQLPSHEYWISRNEAKKIGLPVKNANKNQHEFLKNLMWEFKKKMEEDQRELLIQIPDDSANVEKEYNRAFIETIDTCYSFITNYVFHKNGKVDKKMNQWRKIR